MIMIWLQLGFMLAVILLAAEVFTNALEHAGEQFELSENVTGSIFAAVATALPETLVPLMAIIAGSSDKHTNQEISVGAILGAPMMLSTLSTAIMGIYILKKRGFLSAIKPEKSGFLRDINFFLLAYLVAAISLYIPHDPVILRIPISIIMIGIYVFYLLITLRQSNKLVSIGHGVNSHAPLILSKFKLGKGRISIFLQMFIGIGLLILGAKGFVHSLELIAKDLQVSPLLLSLFIVPIATELPEKVNSLLWLRRNKDTLAVGNITGAMVFQGTLLPALGVLLTPWEPSRDIIISIVITLCATLWLKMSYSSKGISARRLILNGCLYIAYFYVAFFVL